ncbi:hypothetical protein WEI85_02770 [Actinomycetes bacterium KLBMP 9797]
MTQPPYGGAGQPPEGQQPAYQPPPDPFAPPPAQQPFSPDQPPAPPPSYGQYPPAYGQPVSGQPYPSQPVSGQPYPPHPVSGQPYPPYPPQPGYPAYPGGPVAGPPKKRKGLIIVAIVAAAAVLLCGGGITAALLLLRNTEPNPGQAEPVAAVQEFLTAVYTEQNAERAASLVCAEARDKAVITKKVDEVKGYATQYQNPRYKWAEPAVERQDEESATVSVKVTMTTADEKIAEQPLRFTVVQKSGWFVCEIAS